MKKKEKLGQNQFILMFFAFSFGMILSNLLAQKTEHLVSQTELALFVYKGIDKNKEDVSIEIQKELALLESKKYKLVQRAALEQHLHQYAHDKQLNLEQAGLALLKIAAPTDKQVNEFYATNAELINKPFFEVKNQIQKQLAWQQIRSEKYKVLKDLTERGDLVIFPDT